MMKTGKAGRWLLITVAPVAFLCVLSGCAREEAVSFAQDVKPILDQNCLSCHQEGAEGFATSGFGMASYDDLMKGTKFGAMVISGDSEGSNLIVLMEGRADPSISMPHGSMDKVASKDINTIRLWIDQGAKNN